MQIGNCIFIDFEYPVNFSTSFFFKSIISLEEGLKINLNVKSKLHKCNGRAAELVKTTMGIVVKKN